VVSQVSKLVEAVDRLTSDDPCRIGR